MKRYVLSVLVQNQPGVLNRISGLFSRRGYNIDSLTVRETDNPGISRMTVALHGDERIIRQVKNQLNKLVDVIKVIQLDLEHAIHRELALVKINAGPSDRVFIGETVNIFRGSIVDVAEEALTVEITGDEDKISAFIGLMKPYGIREMVRTGITALQRGSKSI